jgi:Fe-S cluster assembly iron-binding protein IscA
MIQVTKRAKRHLDKVLAESSEQTIRIFVEGFG